MMTSKSVAKIDGHDSTVLKVIERWKTTVANEIDDVAGWRDTAAERYQFNGDPARGWGDMPDWLYGYTTYIVCELAKNYPNHDPVPIQNLHDAIAAWHRDHNAEHIPDDDVLMTWADRAMMTLQAVEHAICERAATAVDNGDSKTTSGKLTEKERNRIVGDRIRELESADTPIEKITRDRLVADTGISAGMICKTTAWIGLRDRKRAAKKAEALRSDVVPSNVEEAIEREDWETVLRAQEREEKNQGQYG